MKKKAAVIPIDNRPVCYSLVRQIADLTGDYEVYLPNIELLGDLKNSADINGILSWLEGLGNIDILIMSLDTVAYGGLIPSRRNNDSVEIIKERILKLKEIVEKINAEVYAFSSIMRISNNNINEEEKEYWNLYGEKIYKYSYDFHKSEKTGEAFVSENYGIPADIIADYIETRKRNFEINKLYIDLKKSGMFNTLVFSKDDCSEFGLNIKEAEELKKIIDGINGVFIKTGADEIPLTLFSRAINKVKRIKIHPVYINPDSVDKISKYEDISVKESVEAQIELSGAIVSNEKECDLELIVNNFEKEQGELVMNVNVPLFSGTFTPPDKPYFIADIVNANGSDNNFVKALLDNHFLKEFYGYSAWNTTGNTLGSAISAALTFYGSKHPNKHAYQKLQLIRFLDDWAYQANVRGEIRNNPDNLCDKVLSENMKKYEKIIFQKFGVKNIKSEYKFPWNRFFEIEVNLTNIYFKLPFIDILFYE